jgi:predicted nucleic acid-binding protein
MKYLLDTNIFLEILLKQEKSEKCKKFINDNAGNICISDFALHSIGVILFRNELYDVFNLFLKDFITEIYILTLDKNSYSKISSIADRYKLDFDDSYQLTIVNEFHLSFITLDTDFKKVSKKDFKIYSF